MKAILLLLLFLVSITGNLFAQFTSHQTPAWTFPLYFEDATGAKDTLVLGYDPHATTYGYDTIFGEERDYSCEHCPACPDSTFHVCGSIFVNPIVSLEYYWFNLKGIHYYLSFYNAVLPVKISFPEPDSLLITNKVPIDGDTTSYDTLCFSIGNDWEPCGGGETGTIEYLCKEHYIFPYELQPYNEFCCGELGGTITSSPENPIIMNNGNSVFEIYLLPLKDIKQEFFVIGREKQKSYFRIQPNPVYTSAVLSWSKEIAPTYILLRNIQQVEVAYYKVSKTESSYPIDLSALPSGLYIVEIGTEKQVYFEKITKQ